jgi:hypothetical protein
MSTGILSGERENATRPSRAAAAVPFSLHPLRDAATLALDQ